MASPADTRRPAAALLLASMALVAATPAAAGRDRADPLTVLSARTHGGRGIPTEAEWARDLVGTLGLDRVLSPDAGDAERFALLCADHLGVVSAGDGRQVPGPSPLRVAVATPPQATPGRPLRMVVQVPATALYLFSVEGVGLQRWQLNGRLVGHLDPSALGLAQAPAVLPLREGPYELAATLAPQSRVDHVELAAHRSLCIAPADGWRANRPLRWGVMARTLVHVLGLEGQLPSAGGSIPLEGEDYVETSGGERSPRRLRNDPSGRVWARASHGPAEFVYRVELETPGLFSLQARMPGGGAQLWSVDGRYRATLRPRGSKNEFHWNSVLTLPLASGRHVVRVVVTPGSGIDRMRLVPHARDGAAYVKVLGRAGFAEGAPDAPVTRRAARRSLDQLVETPGAERFLTRYADGTGRRPPAEPAGPPMTGPAARPTEGFRPETWR